MRGRADIKTAADPRDAGAMGVGKDTEIEVDWTDTDTEIVEDEAEIRLWMFVAMMTVHVFKMCGTLHGLEEDAWVRCSQRLVNKTMEGLPRGIVPSTTTKKMAKSVVQELGAKFGKRLKHMLFLEDPGVDAIITECFQSHIQGSPRETCSCGWCIFLLCGLFVALAMVLITTLGFLFYLQ